jgi:hypothetical protein
MAIGTVGCGVGDVDRNDGECKEEEEISLNSAEAIPQAASVSESFGEPFIYATHQRI